MAASDPRTPIGRFTPVNLNKGKSVDNARGKKPVKRLSMGRHAALDVARRASITKTRAITVSNKNKSLILDPINMGRNSSTPANYLSKH